MALPPSFDGENDRRNIPDFIVNQLVIIDVKAKKFIIKEDYNQMQRYLNSINLKLGLIVNFRSTYLKSKRVINYKIN
jgi:GxxExxY protein